MSFGFGVGDFLAVAKLANDIWQKLHDSVGQFADIREEVKGYSSLLYSVSKTLSNQYLAPEQAEGLDASARACRSVLEDLQKLVDKYRRLTNEAHGLTANVRQKAKKLQWDQDDARDLRARITSTTTVLRGLCETVARDQQACSDLCQWLSPLDFPAQQREIYSRQQHGSGQWLLQSERYLRWLESEGGVLLCPGDPGAGKTVLASIVIHDLWNKFRKKGIGVAYIYCDYLKYREQTPVHLVGSLLRQLAEQHKLISESLKNYHDEHKNNNIDPSPEGAFEVLKAECDSWSQVFIIIDAQDECTEKDSTRKSVIEGLRLLQASKRINILVTTRPIPSILCEFEAWERLGIRANSADMQKYLLGRMDQFSKRVVVGEDLQAQIISAIINAADGMFLLARLTFDSLVGHKNLKAIKDTLGKLSEGACSLDSAYDDAMKRIQAQHPDERDLAEKTLLWITQGQRSLSVAEIQQAIAIELGDSDLDPDSTVHCDDIISACTGLVTRGRDFRDREILRLVHYTTQEYLERTKTKYFPEAQKYIASSCLTYLLFDVFSGALCPPRQDDVRYIDSDTGVGNKAGEVFCFGCKRCWTAEQHEAEREELNGSRELESYNKDPCSYLRRKQYPFYEYAVLYWGHHAENCDDEAIGILTKIFLDDYKRVSGAFAFVREGYGSHGSLRLKLRDSNPGSAMQLAAFLGLSKLMSKRLDDGFEPDVKDKDGRTPLSWAVIRGHEDVVKLLMAREDVDPNVRDRKGETPLVAAIKERHEAMVRLLLAYKHVDINAIDGKWGRSALVWAITQKQEGQQILKILLACDNIELNVKNRQDLTPLMITIYLGDVESTRHLLAHGDIQPNIRDNEGQTVLHIAAIQPWTENMRLLLAHSDIQVNAMNNRGETALHIASSQDRVEGTRLLLAHKDIQVNVRNELGQTALHIAAKNRKPMAVRFLLAHKNLDVNAADDKGQTALFSAVSKIHGLPKRDVAQLFLARGDVDVNIRDIDGYAPLYHAVRSGQPDVVQLFLTRKDLEISIENGEGGKLISLAEDERDKAIKKRKYDAYNGISFLLRFYLRFYLEQRSSNTTSANLKQQIPQRIAHTKDGNDDDDDDNNDNAAHGTDNVQVIEEQMLDLAVEESP